MTPALRRCAAAAALGLIAACAGAQDGKLSYKYFYEDVFTPFFALDRAAGVYRPVRDGSISREFAAVKPAGAFRVFVIGGSIAGLYKGRGDLQDWLGRSMPGRPVEVVNCGMSGYDSPREQLVLEEVLGYSPDAIVLMTGHNESLALSWAPRWKLEAARLGRSLGAVPRPAASFATGDVRRRAIADRLAEFEARVRGMGRACAARKVPLVVLLPPLNVRDVPSKWLLPKAGWFRAGWRRYLSGDCPGARAAWARPPAGVPQEASLADFFAGRCLEAEGRGADARESYERALAEDEPLLGRCGTDCRAALRRAGGEPGVFLADGDAEFRRYAAPDLPGFDEFSDAVHWRKAMHPLITRALAAALRRASVGGLTMEEPPLPPRPAPERVEDEWTALLRAGVAELRPDAGALSAGTLAALEYAARRRREPLGSAAELELLETDSNKKGRAWGMPALLVPRGPYHWALADVLLVLGRVDEAGASFEAAARAGARGELFASDRSDYYRRSGDAVRARKEESASRRAGMVAAAGDGRRQDYYALARADPAAARRFAADFAHKSAQDAGAREKAARMYEWLGDTETARGVWCRPPVPNAAAGLGCARTSLALGDREGAAAAARAALAAAGPGERAEAARILQDAGRAEEALAALEAASRAAPDDASLALDWGVALFLAGRAPRAAEVLARAASLEPEPGDAALSLAAALDSLGRGAEAEKVLRDARARARGGAIARFDAALAERAK